jgi:hypothetical protein
MMKHLCKHNGFRIVAFAVIVGVVFHAFYWTYPDWNVSAATPFDLNEFVTERGSLTFRSYDGKCIGSDCDTEITFMPDQVAYLVGFNDDVAGYKCTYTIDSKGQVRLQFLNSPYEWLVMVLRRDATSLLLRPCGWREGVFTSRAERSRRGKYWPFRPVSEDEETRTREELNRWVPGR